MTRLVGLFFLVWQSWVELTASDNSDPLKTWLRSLTFHLPDSENQTNAGGSSATFLHYDMQCTNLQFDRLHSDKFMSMHDPVLELIMDGVSVDCEGKFKSLGWVSWLTIGHGSWTATLNGQNGAVLEVMFPRDEPRPDLLQPGSTRCNVAFHADVTIQGGLAVSVVNLMQKILSPIVNEYVGYQIQSKVCGALEEKLRVKAPYYIHYLNHLFFDRPMPTLEALKALKARRLPETPATNHTWPNGSIPSSDDKSANSSNAPVDDHSDPKLVDWTQSGLLQWSNWFYTKVLPPDVARELAKAAGPDFLTLDVEALNLPPFETVVDQQGALGLELDLAVEVKEIQLKGFEGIQAYDMRAVSPTQLVFSGELGSEEFPVTSMAATLGIKAVARDEIGAVQSSLDEEISFTMAVKRPRGSAQVRVPIGEQEIADRRTLAQWISDPVNCGRSLLVEAPTLQELNLSFEDLDKPLQYIANTKGQLEEDISNFFNVMVSIFNELFQAHLPGAVARLGTSKEALGLANSLLKKEASPVECISVDDALNKVKGQYPETYSDWPKMLDGQMHTLMSNMIHGLLATNETKAPSGWLEMPPVDAAALKNLHVKDLKVDGTLQISELKFLDTNEQTPETIAFDMEASCPSEEKPYPVSMVMTVEGTLDETGEALVQVDFPCGTLATTLNLSIDTMEAVNMLMPPSLFCTLLSPFKTMDVTNLTTSGGGGKVYVTIGSGQRHDVIQELCGEHPKLCALIGRVGAVLSRAENATIILKKLHKEALARCENMIKGSGRRLSTELKDAVGISYEEFHFGMLSFCVGIPVCFIIAPILVWTINFCEKRTVRRDNAALGVKIIRSHGMWLAVVIALFLLLAVCFRDIACNQLAYVSVVLRNRYKPTDKTIDTQTLAVFTYWGLAYQFKAASLFLSFEWAFNGFGITMVLFLVFLLAFVLFRFSPKMQHVILRVGIFFSRRPWQESATLGLSALAMTADLQLPVDVEGQMRMNMWAGPVFSILSTLCLTIAGVSMLVSMPLKSAEVEEENVKKPMVLLDLVLASGIILGVFIWFCFDFVEVGFSGMAATLMEPKKYSGLELGSANPGAKLPIIMVFVVAPFLQACMVMFRSVGLKLMSPNLQRIIEETCMSLNSLDVFALAFLAGFLGGVDGFTSSFVNNEFAELCQATLDVANTPCIGVTPSTVTFGNLGLIIGAACTFGLYIRSSVRYHTLVPDPVRRRDVESDGAVAVELQ